jgi:hypothetical protein
VADKNMMEKKKWGGRFLSGIKGDGEVIGIKEARKIGCDGDTFNTFSSRYSPVTVTRLHTPYLN